MQRIPPECRGLYRTVNDVDYIAPSLSSKRIPAKVAVSEDPLVIDGNCAINLNVNGKPLAKALKNHPTIKPANENYFDFIDKIEGKSQVLYDRFFKGVEIEKQYIEDEIANINKTEYQVKYSPSEFMPLSKYVRLLRRNLTKPPNWKYHDTTYLNFYSRINEFGDLRDVLKSEDFRQAGRRPVADELNRIYRTGRSIYQTSYPGRKMNVATCKV